jgi:hypothetical protein
MQTDPDIQHTILSHLRTRRTADNPQPMNSFLTEGLVNSQDPVGWRHFLKGGPRVNGWRHSKLVIGQ